MANTLNLNPRKRNSLTAGLFAKSLGVSAIIALIGGLCAVTLAEGQSFSGFTSGNLVVTRSAYSGDASTVTVGQALPPICPQTAKCGTGAATDNGAFPSADGGNNVWNDSAADASFAIESPIFLDQITPTGTLINTLSLPPNLLTTSFSSKSELAVNLSPDGTSLTLMGYVAPQNSLDVSSSNTPGVYDPTNPAGSSYYRAVAQIGANGAIQVTYTNAYSGSNGRAAILVNGQYYMVGNSNNGGGTPANVVASTGVQIATPNQPAGTMPMQIGSFSITQVKDPDTGTPYPPDKLGKDSNFRGLTIFGNTLYVTKGSGSNGINTVYQVGESGSLPTAANAGSTPITILPGFPTTLARNGGAVYPFGIWFANANTLYVADEGDGSAGHAATSTDAGLQKWSRVNGTWHRDYVLQSGLSLGQPYSVNNLPTTLNPSTDGLRNLTGKVNNDGTVTIWAVTSTISANPDQGADPNRLVSISDLLANTDPGVAANEKFTTLITARAGEVLRGVSFAPTSGGDAIPSRPTIQSAANLGATAIAPNSLATANGINLATGTAGSAPVPLPAIFGGTSISIRDSAGNVWAAPLLYVSPGQVNFEVPSGVAAGTAQVTITSGDGTQSTASVQVAALAPGLFTFNNAGLIAANALRALPDGVQTPLSVFAISGTGSIVASPIPEVTSGQVFLVLYGTGLQLAGPDSVKVSIAGVDVPVQYAGSQGSFAGLDQVNLLLPSSLSGKGNVNIQLMADGIPANPVQVTIQ